MSDAFSLHNHRIGVPASLRMNAAEDEIRCEGDWTALCLEAAEVWLERLDVAGRAWRVDAGGIRRLDSAGALALRELQAKVGSQNLTNLSATHAAMLAMVDTATVSARDPREVTSPAAKPRLQSWLAEILAVFEFLGVLTRIALPRLLRPWQLRYRRMGAELEQAGVQALPIVGLLTFLMGGVIAFQGGVALRQYGADVFLVDLVGITMLREMAPLLVAVVAAGRTGAAYTAEIGSMKATQEVDALRTLSLHPYEILVLPKLLALAIALPLLTAFAMVTGLAGGAVFASLLFEMDWRVFAERMPSALASSHFWVGMVKAPVFAAIIGTIGCYHGLRTRADAQAVGQATTVSVVQAIFLIIVVDALFSILFNQLGW